MTPTLEEIDLTDPELYAEGDPHAVFRYLRGNAPVFFQRQRSGPGFWAITKYEDVRRVSRPADIHLVRRHIHDGSRAS